MATQTTPTPKPAPKTVSDLTLAELLTLLQETVTEALVGIVGCPDEEQESSHDTVEENGKDRDTGAGESKPAYPATTTRVYIADEATRSARLARKVSELEVGELEWWIYYIVDEVGEKLIGDPDEGLELSPWVQEQLAQADADRAAGTLKTIPLEEAAKRLGLSP